MSIKLLMLNREFEIGLCKFKGCLDMKKMGALLGILAILCLGGFFWLLSQASPQNAPKDVVTIDLPDTYEK